MNEYGCSYCNRHFTTFTACVGHCVNEHNESQLKLKRGCLDPKTGLFKYKQLVFSITPSDITLSGHIIVPIEKTHDIYLSLTVPKPPNDASRESENCVDVPKQCTSSMQKGDNGAPPIHSGLLDDHDCPKAPTSGPTDKADEDAGDDINFVLSVQEFKTLTPRALDRLRDSGHLQSFCSLWEMIANGVFPLDNIAFKLFMDVVNWYHVGNTSTMRYSDITKMFWRTGYKLFRGKFLRFMGGFKNFGDIVAGRSLPGCCSASLSRVNFAVPSLHILRDSSLQSLFPTDSIRPGILKTLVQKEIEARGTGRWYKLCVDGKQI